MKTPTVMPIALSSKYLTSFFYEITLVYLGQAVLQWWEILYVKLLVAVLDPSEIFKVIELFEKARITNDNDRR